ncbi:MAG: hypothetical protein ACPHK8_00635 [Thermoplasmatota archaeon]
MKPALAVALALLVAGCTAPAQLGPCGEGEPTGAGHLRYALDDSLSRDYALRNATVTFLQVADINERPTPNTSNVEGRTNANGCIWYTLEDGYYHVTIVIPNNEAGGKGFFEETPYKLVGDDHNLTLGFHNG